MPRLAAVPVASAVAGTGDSPLKYANHVDSGIALYHRVCHLDLEGIVAKLKSGPYVSDRENSTWFKILNRNYSQREGRDERVTGARNQYRAGIRVLSHVPNWKRYLRLYESLRGCWNTQFGDAPMR